jgi:phosphatidylglycerol:prolipoprotein diacylglycerol transferase
VKPIPVSFHIGPLLVHTYGIGLAVTFWFAYRYFERRLRSRGYPTAWVLPMFIWVVVAAVIGARAMHGLANLSYYRADPGQIIAIWHGGLSSWGGLLLGVPTGLVITRRRCPQLRLGPALDIVAPVLAAAWAIGRLLGPQLMVAGGGHLTHQWFGMYYAGQPGRRLPVPIFQAAEDASIFVVLLAVERRLRRRGAAGGAPAEDTTPLAAVEGGDVVVAAAPRVAPTLAPAGGVVGAAMVLWGIERVVDERLWLAYPGHIGDVLVEAAGLALALAGVVVLVRYGRRLRAWTAAHPPGTPLPTTLAAPRAAGDGDGAPAGTAPDAQVDAGSAAGSLPGNPPLSVSRTTPG